MAHAFRLMGVDHELWLSRSGGVYKVHVGDMKQFHGSQESEVRSCRMRRRLSGR